MSRREQTNENAAPRRAKTILSLRSRLYTSMLLIGLSLCLLLCVVTYFGNLQRWSGLIDGQSITLEHVEHFAAEEAWRSTASAMMVLLLIVLVVDRVICGYVIHPLEEMMKVLARRAAGSGSAYVRLPQDDQFGKLADRLNGYFDSAERFDLETRKRALVAERTEHAVLLCDDKGEIEWVNDAFTATTGYTLQDSLGRRPGDVLQGPQSDHGTVAYMRECLAMRVPFQVEVLNYRKSGESYWNALEVRPIFDAEGRLQNYMAICRDVTQVKETQKKYDEMVRDVLSARAQLEEQTLILQLRNDELNDARRKAETAMRTKSEFLANMSHEIRTPMTAILGFSGILLEGIRDTNMVQAAQTIQRNGEYLLELINDILDLSKIEAGALRIENIPSTPVQIVDDVVGLMKFRADEKRLTMNVEYQGTIPEHILTDPTRLRQILLNLMGNAVKFTMQGEVQLDRPHVERGNAPLAVRGARLGHRHVGRSDGSFVPAVHPGR
ncbi:MAG: PAS domain-containing protein [Pirellulales bacterium]